MSVHWDSFLLMTSWFLSLVRTDQHPCRPPVRSDAQEAMCSSFLLFLGVGPLAAPQLYYSLWSLCTPLPPVFLAKCSHLPLSLVPGGRGQCGSGFPVAGCPLCDLWSAGKLSGAAVPLTSTILLALAVQWSLGAPGSPCQPMGLALHGFVHSDRPSSLSFSILSSNVLAFLPHLAFSLL